MEKRDIKTWDNHISVYFHLKQMFHQLLSSTPHIKIHENRIRQLKGACYTIYESNYVYKLPNGIFQARKNKTPQYEYVGTLGQKTDDYFIVYQIKKEKP